VRSSLRLPGTLSGIFAKTDKALETIRDTADKIAARHAELNNWCGGVDAVMKLSTWTWSVGRSDRTWTDSD